MCNKDDLVSYLYDDLDGASRLSFERHLRGCAGCRDELAAMRAVRADLLTWSPPAATACRSSVGRWLGRACYG